MFARTTFLFSVAVLTGGALATPTFAGDFGISFHYRSDSPRHYSTCYVPADDVCYAYYDCLDPVVYVCWPRPQVVVYDSCYPVTYRTTYSRAYHYRHPVRHTRATVHRGTRYYERKVTRRHHYRTSRSSDCKYYRDSGSRGRHRYVSPRSTSRRYYHSSRSRCRPSDSVQRYSSSHRYRRDVHRRPDDDRRRARVHYRQRDRGRR